MLDNLSRLRTGRTKRVSSWDTSGGNADAWTIPPGETMEIAGIAGAGTIRHIWMTVAAADRLYLRKAMIRMYWDGQAYPSVEAPLGDFFGVGHAKVASYSSVALDMSANEGNDLNAGMNCWFPMPFSDGARIDIINHSETEIRSFYFYIDYDEMDAIPEDEGRFHALWRRDNPCPAPTPGGEPGVNLSDKDNYVILEAAGRGHYVGYNLSVHNLHGGWWGEGDDMVMIDGHKWPPDLHGTGSEDYFSQAWGSQPKNAFPYHGVSYHSGPHPGLNERITVYRYHVVDPIIFDKSIRVSIEHGHANDRQDDYSSTAYWYQTLPTQPFPLFPFMDKRLPMGDIDR